MTEIANPPVNAPRSYTKIIIIIIIVLALLLVYGAGTIGFPAAILYRYHTMNCDSVLSWNNWYESTYPEFVRDTSIVTQIEECEDYLFAVSNEESGNWGDAYHAYQDYAVAYPAGLFVDEAHEHSATVLMNLADGQISQKNYDEALTNLNLILSDYSDTSVVEDAVKRIASIYIAWGTEQREAENFDQAERVFNDFKSWTQNNQRPELKKDAADGLLQTYLDWGLALQSRKQFDEALTKFDMAANIDPQLAANAAAEAKSHQRKLYVIWGNDLLEQSEFSAAIEKFQLGVSKADAGNEDGVNDALANGYIQWAHQYTADEDFLGALEKMAVVDQMAVSAEMKKTAEAALNDTYLAFSKSTGDQARRAMRTALIDVCDKHKKPDLPIFGIDKDSIRFGFYGVDDKLPESVAARTPGEMHYIACVEEGNHTVASRWVKVILLRVAGGYYYKYVQQFRAELLWNINLYKTDTRDKVGEMTFTGGTPPPFADDSDGSFFYGPPPEVEEVAKWLLSTIK